MTDIHGIISAPAEARPAILEGRWLNSEQSLVAVEPAGVFEGEARNFGGLSDWLTKHAALHPGGGAIGFLTYELARDVENVPLRPAGRLPDFSFAYFPRIERPPARDATLLRPSGADCARTVRDFDKARFIADVTRIRNYIAAGDIYQANLTQSFTACLGDLAPETIYVRLAAGRAPRRAFLKTPQATMISDSPERFFHVRANRILTSPIKGTLARSGDPGDDARRRKQLLASAKDRAENVMIVDLLRNDLGRICRYETIDARLWELDELPHLFHLVSHVEGELRPGAGPLEIVRALFPCGSVTGAPKIRAMEILAEIERAPRGVSMGAIGIILGAPSSPGFEMDFNVAIRTITVQEGTAEFNVGCGIVYDSESEAEYAEMLLKAQPLVNALGLELPGAGHRSGDPVSVAPQSERWSCRSQSRRS